MWLLSLLAQLETRNKYKRQIKELNDKLHAIEEEKKNIVAAVPDVPSDSANLEQSVFENAKTVEAAGSDLSENTTAVSEKE